MSHSYLSIFVHLLIYLTSHIIIPSVVNQNITTNFFQKILFPLGASNIRGSTVKILIEAMY